MKRSKTQTKQVKHRHVKLKIGYGIAITIIIAIVLFSLTQDNQRSDNNSLILSSISSESTGFLQGNTINPSALESFDSRYEQIKQTYGISQEFYVVFEDNNGKPMPVDGKICFGSKKAQQIDPRCSLN